MSEGKMEDRRKQSKYASRSNLDGMARITEKLLKDLRKSIRALGMFPVLSQEWLNMSDSLSRISNAVTMEATISKKNKDSSTLWDCEEQALRFLLEDGKLNLCLRLIIEVKEFEQEVIKNNTEMKIGDRTHLRSFEKSLGTILFYAWKHKEAVRTTDLPLLLGHIAYVLKNAVIVSKQKNTKATNSKIFDIDKEQMKQNSPNTSSITEEEKTPLPTNSLIFNPKNKKCTVEIEQLYQETLVIHYLHAVLEMMDFGDILEESVMPLIKKNKVVKFLTSHLNRKHAYFSTNDYEVGCLALAIVFNSEDFSMYKEKYFKHDFKKEILKLQTVADVVSHNDRRKKKALRPLIDTIQRLEIGK